MSVRSVGGAITRVVGFLRAGYPQGLPAPDTFPVLAVLPRRPAPPAHSAGVGTRA
ncbi:DUF3349 domain-containing protein [Mycobacterium kiyosense]|uniref:DUF3349 domain-containing protein n=2 Tax=Mycobacteriaceae TaxID=1762 RepID=UPI001F3EB06E|nr:MULTISPECIES: DUF3349 domain-containing protein [Mycobacterium]